MKLVLNVLCLLCLAACSSTDKPLKPRERKTTTIGGYVVTVPTSEEEDLRQKKELVRRQNEEISRQKSEIEDARRQEYYNERMRDYSRRTFGGAGDSWTEDEEGERHGTEFKDERSNQFPDDHY